MTALETLIKVLNYKIELEEDSMIILTKECNGLNVRLGIGRNIGVGYLVNDNYGPVDPFTLATCVNYMIEKGWVDLSQDINFYIHKE